MGEEHSISLLGQGEGWREEGDLSRRSNLHAYEKQLSACFTGGKEKLLLNIGSQLHHPPNPASPTFATTNDRISSSRKRGESNGGEGGEERQWRGGVKVRGHLSFRAIINGKTSPRNDDRVCRLKNQIGKIINADEITFIDVGN